MATRQLLDTADPAEAGRRTPQVERAIAAFLAQPAGPVTGLNDALADQMLILAHHFRVDEAYFTDPAVAEDVTARRRRGDWSVGASASRPASAGEARGLTATGAQGAGTRGAGTGGASVEPADARRSRTLAGVAAVSVALVAGAAIGGAVGYRMGTGAGRSEALAEVPAPAAPAPVAPGDHRAPDGDPLQQVARRVQPAVAQIRVHSGAETAMASGIVLSADGLLLTTNHLVATAAPGQITVQFENGTSRPAHVVGHDPASDIAVVAAENLAGLTPIRLGNSDTVRVGQPVVALGSSLGSSAGHGATVTRGVVSALNRPIVVGHDGASKAPEVLNAIQIDAAVGPAESGGPLVDDHGFVVGLLTALPGAVGPDGSAKVGLAVPINQAERIAERIIDTSRAAQTIMGAQIATSGRPAPPNELPGAKIVAVAPGSPAGNAGLKAGDVVVKFNGRPVTSGEEFVAMTKALAPGDTVTLQLGDGRPAHVVLARRPVAVSR